MALLSHFRPCILLAVNSLWLTACAPALTCQLRPVSGDVAQIDGRTVTKAVSSDSLVVVASYEREDLQYIALDIEVQNHTARPLDIDPARFVTTALDVHQTPLPDPTSPEATYQRSAADPDREARQVVINRGLEEKRLKRAKILNTVLMVALVAGSVAASSKPQTYEKYVSNQVTYNGLFNGLQAKRIIDHATFANRMQRLDYEAYRWHELAMKRTTLQPGESVRGYVYLTKAPKAAFLQLLYPTDTGVAILFEQSMSRKR